ncbi:hypothetical protein BP5796_02927 [Coleophoma crateriformis]|uniref:Uncharacterized protein n=1 Tax=Coleophoma crateriformis TaxID=565419 RepID=A0A3D8SLP4_9HELO|nr:hypothetical protein BP5796_02927 [Coleophoma crateriformis]
MPVKATPSSSLHFLVPATSSNHNLCKLLLSAAILRYPPPILINWGALEDKENAYVQHLAKVETILKYLDTLVAKGKKDDLALIVDGFDVHFQLPPEVMLQRYFEANAAAQRRINLQVGADTAISHGLKQSVIFGHDKLCWPIDARRPACWLVPLASDRPFAFGPETDQAGMEKAKARWLNSGTIMGPVGDIQEVFQATLALIQKKHVTDSDQFYFANIYANQEYSRRLLQPEGFGVAMNRTDLDWPELEPNQITERGIGIDYEGLLYQTMAFFHQSLTWITFDGASESPGSRPAKYLRLSTAKYHQKVLPQDIQDSRPPFAAVTEKKTRSWIRAKAKAPEADNGPPLPAHLSWKDVSLGINVASNNIFPLLHFTGEKEYRDTWWPRMWYYPYGEALLKATAGLKRSPLSKRVIGGKIWWPGEVVTREETLASANDGDRVGAFADHGAFLSWEALCRTHEPLLFPQKAKEEKEDNPSL